MLDKMEMNQKLMLQNDEKLSSMMSQFTGQISDLSKEVQDLKYTMLIKQQIFKVNEGIDSPRERIEAIKL